MMHRIPSRWACAIAGPALIALASACSDAPSSPWPSTRNAEPERAVEHVADVPIRADAPFVPTSGEMVSRREVRSRDGHRYLIETIRGQAGLPRDVRVTRDGQLMARLRNEWRHTGNGYLLERQRLARFDNGRLFSAMDSRTSGGISTLAAGPIMLRQGMAATGVRLSARVRAMEGDLSTDGGPCDAEAAKVEEAIDDWLLSVVAVGGAVWARSVQAAVAAWAYQVTAYRDMTRAEATLDVCVEKAGKPGDEL